MKSTLNDAILADILDDLGRVQKATKALPDELKEATQTLTTATEAARNHAGELQKTATAVVSASVESTRAELSKMVAHSAEKIAVNKSRKELTAWVVGCLCGAFALFAGFGAYFLKTGMEIGFQKGVAEAQLSAEYQSRVFAWSTTTEGKMALAFAELGGLRRSLHLRQSGLGGGASTQQSRQNLAILHTYAGQGRQSLGVATSMILQPPRQTIPLERTIQPAQKKKGEHTNCPPFLDLIEEGRLMDKTVSLPTQNTRSLDQKVSSTTPNRRSHAPQQAEVLR